jgi:hypothetical protein
MKSIVVVTCAVCLIALAPRSYGQHFATLYSISGDLPVGLTSAKGVLYGATSGGGGNGPGSCGTVFDLQPPDSRGGPWTPVVLYSFIFGVGGPDACQPLSAPVVGAGGVLYGVTSQGGVNPPSDFGALYAVQPPATPGGTWTEEVLYSFGTPGTNISTPASNIAPGPAGSYYVLTTGGDTGPPVLAQLRPPASPGGAWTGAVLYSFPGGPGFVRPNSLVAGPNGVLYGTNDFGGRSAPDAVFQLTPPAAPGGAWTETVIHSFFTRGGGPVNNPIALTVAADGTIYGTAYGYTLITGGHGASAIFQLTPPATTGGQWTYTNLTTPTFERRFVTPVALVDGNLYGGISNGNGGSIFELQPPSASGGAWTMTTLHVFTDGQVPTGNLVVEPNGAVYGTTAAAPGQPSGGTVFAIMTK